MPTWVWVLPTSMASSTAASLRRRARAGGATARAAGGAAACAALSQRSTHGVEAAVHVQDLARDRAREVREQEQHGVRHRRGIGRVPVKRGLLAPEAGEGVEAGDALSCGRLDRSGRDEVHAYVLPTEV